MIMKYLMGVLAGALLGALALVAIQTSRVGRYKAELDSTLTENMRLQEAAIGSEQTIERQAKSIAGILEAARQQGEALVAAVATLKARDAMIEKQSADLAAAEAADHALPECQALLNLDLARLCPAHADSVRKRAAGRLSGSNSRGSDPGTGPPAG